jgi:hypothetical protein
MKRDAAAAFFFKHAGYAYDPKTETPTQGKWRCARELAAAERYAQRNGWQYEWVDDPDWDGKTLCCHEEPQCPPPHEVLGCVLRGAEGRSVLASLWSIGDPSPEYKRVVEAELAFEAMP